MKLRPVKKIQDINKDNMSRVVSQVQDNVSALSDQLFLNPMLVGVLKTTVFLANADTYVNHGLGVNYQGFIPANPDSLGIIAKSKTENLSPDKYIILTSDADMTADIWIY